MNPLISQDLVALRQQELYRQAGIQRRARAAAAPWDHRWRRGLGAQLEQWGRRLQAAPVTEHPIVRARPG